MSYIKLGWIKLKKFTELSGISEAAIKQRMENANFPEWRIGSGMIKLFRDGYHINWEAYQEWADKQPAVA